MIGHLVSLPLQEGWFCPSVKTTPANLNGPSGLADADVHQLTARVAQGDEKAFSELYDLYQARLFRLVIVLSRGDELLAHEMVQAAFLTAARKLRCLESEAHLWNWLARVARQHLAKTWRQQARDPVLADPEVLSEQANPEQADSVLEEHLNMALAEMEAFDRQTLEWFYFDRLSHQEIAEKLGTTTKAISSRLERTRAALRRILQRRLSNEK
jgi:RNA polymerase sigma-70 factor, ECF subfamily